MSVKTYLVDLRKETEGKNTSLFSSFLLKQLEENLARGEQSILFLNKRGHSTTYLCSACGEVKMCTHCDISMTHHRHHTTGEEYLLCHFCGSKEMLTPTCSSCGKEAMKFIGSGTQRLEIELKSHLPKARIARMDMDTTRNKHTHDTLYHAMQEGAIDILLGTQVLAKGLDIPKVTLVGILNADTGLHIPDFRASERIFQLLTQVMGRASRQGQEGKIIIQTYNPESPLIAFAAQKDYDGFYEYLKEERKTYNYPPFSQLVRCVYVHKDRVKAYSESKKMYDLLQGRIREQKLDLEAFLAPAFISKQYDKYHYHILLKGQKVHEFLLEIEFPSNWRVDVDPIHTA